MRLFTKALISFLLVPLSCLADDDAMIRNIFSKYHVNGTIVVSSLDDQKKLSIIRKEVAKDLYRHQHLKF